MNKLITLCLIFFSLVLCGQERITEFDRKVGPLKSFVTQKEDKNFIVSVNTYDRIDVFEIINTVPIKSHSTVIDGAYDSAIQAGEPGFLLLKNAQGGIIYNIVNNAVFELKFKEGFSEIEWESNKYYEILMLQSSSDGSLKKYEIVNLNSGKRTHIDTNKRVRDVSKNAILSNANGLYYVENRNTSAVDSFTLNGISSSSFYYSKDIFLLVSDNDFYKFDAVSREKTIIHSNNTSGSRSGIRGGENVILFKERPYDLGYYLDVVFLDDSYNVINILNLDEFDNQEIYNFFDLYFISDFIGAKVTFWFRDRMYVLNMETGSYKSFNCTTINGRNIVQLDQNNILCRVENDIIKINLYTLQDKIIAEDLNLPSKIKTLKIDNETLLLGEEDIYAVDNQEATVEIRNYIPRFSDGMHGYSQLFKVGDDVILAEEGINWITEEGVNQISTNKIIWPNNPFKVRNDAFYWFEINEEVHECFKFKNGQVTKIASVNNLYSSGSSQLREFFIIEDEVFYIRKNESSSIYKCMDNQIGEAVVDHYIGTTNPKLYVTNEYLIYNSSNKVRAIDKNGNSLILDEEDGLSSNVLLFKNNLFIQRSHKGIKKVGIDGAAYIFEGENRFMFDIDNQYIHILSGENIFVYDDEFVDTIPFVDNYYSWLRPQGYFTFLSTDTSGEDAYYWYNNYDRSIVKLDMLDLNSRIINVVQHNEDYLIFATDKITQQGVNLNIYQMNHDGSEWKSIIDFPIYLDNYEINFKSIGDKGLLLANDYICLIDEFSEINRFQNIKGEYYNQEIIEAGEYLYFMAEDELYGRQVYRIYKDILIGSKPLDINQVSIFPNPSSAYLNIDLNNDIYTNFEIFNTQGVMFQSANIQQDVPIDIRDLDSGYYVIKLIGKSKAVSKAFIKID